MSDRERQQGLIGWSATADEYPSPMTFDTLPADGIESGYALRAD